MAMHHRVRRLERSINVDHTGFRACRACNNGEHKRLVFLMEGEPTHGARTDTICPSCGRDLAHIINFVRAEPPPGYAERNGRNPHAPPRGPSPAPPCAAPSHAPNTYKQGT